MNPNIYLPYAYQRKILFLLFLYLFMVFELLLSFSKFLVIVFILSTPKTPFEHALDFLLHDFEMAGEILF